ncbi:PAS domain-containing protein [Arenibacterium sp. CAU 1754]
MNMTIESSVGLKHSDREKVISMARFRSGASLSPIRQAEAYWTALRDGAGIPRRTQIDPRGLENLLEYAFILERIAPGIARFRLAGQHLTNSAGMEVRGMPITAFFTPAARGQMSAILEHLFDAPAVAKLSLTSEARYRAPPYEAHMILLPLKCDLGAISRALGVLVSDAPGTQVPTRFNIAGSTSRLVADMPVAVPPQERPVRHAPVAGFAEPPVAPLGGRAPHLRLVSSED